MKPRWHIPLQRRTARLLVLGLALLVVGATLVIGVVTLRQRTAATCTTCTPVVAPASSETSGASAVTTSSSRAKPASGASKTRAPGTAQKQAGRTAPSGTPGGSAAKPAPSPGASASTPAPKPAPAPAPAPVPAATVTISIDCRTVPSVGMILSARSVTLRAGDTVYAVLQRACSSAGIALDTAQYPGSGVYIRGIGGVSERAHGPLSGWLYSVNGAFAGVGCSNYSVSAGDVIVFRYTCNGGSDVGR